MVMVLRGTNAYFVVFFGLFAQEGVELLVGHGRVNVLGNVLVVPVCHDCDEGGDVVVVVVVVVGLWW